MKSCLFFLILLLLVGSGAYLLAARFDLLDAVEISQGEILPKEEWAPTLVGKWKYKRVLQASYYAWVYEGEVEYTPDGNFTRFVSCKYYEGNRGTIIKDFNLHAVAGGSYSGKWAIDSSENFFREDIKKCNVSVGRVDDGYNLDDAYFCEGSFAPSSSWVFGDYSFEHSKYSLMQFNQDKIVVEGTLYNEGASVKITFTKQD